jgi:hypothetical protein
MHVNKDSALLLLGVVLLSVGATGATILGFQQFGRHSMLAAQTAPSATARSSLRYGYTTWRGLPMPEYFQLQTEHAAPHPDVPGGGPRVCTEATFYHGLNDPSQVWQEMQLEWRKLGIQYNRQIGAASLYRFTTATGHMIQVWWVTNPTSLGAKTVMITDCPANSGPAQ